MSDKFELLKSETVPLTFELAAKFKDMESSPVERPISERRIAFLEKKAKDGDLVSFNWVTAELDGREVRLNGNHSSRMLFGLNGEFPKNGYVHRDHYRVDSNDGLVRLFRQMDGRQSGRSAADIAGAFQGAHSELDDVTRPNAKIGAESITWWGKHVEGVPVKEGDDQYGLLGNAMYNDFLHFLDTILDIKSPELRNKQVVAAIYATYDKNPEQAKLFWTDVRHGDAAGEGAPATVLDEWLINVKKISDTKRKPKPGSIYTGCAYAWTAFRQGEDITGIRAVSKKALHELITG